MDISDPGDRMKAYHDLATRFGLTFAQIAKLSDDQIRLLLS